MFKRFRASIPFAAALFCSFLAPRVGTAVEVTPEVQAAEAARIEVLAKICPSVLAVQSPDGQGGGSGVVISPDGYALSNFHVTKPCGDWMRCGMADGRAYDAVIVGVDPVGDVALIKLLGRTDFPFAEMGDSDKVQVGDWAFAIGNPFLLATDFTPTVSYGMISGVHRYQYPAGTLLEYADCIQTDAAINPGNSGGPLFNATGQLIGINGRGSFEKRGRVNVGVGYAISINQIKHFLGHLKSGRILDHATLGALVSTHEDGRVLVSDILEDSDAYRRGLRYDDELVRFGNRPIRTVNAFKNALGIYPKGWRVPLSYRRDGETYDISVRLAGVHSTEELMAKLQNAPTPEPPQPDKAPGPDKQPAPGEPQPDGSQPDPSQPKTPRGPTPPILPGAPKTQAMPDHVKALYATRHGFANYYFNQLERDRVWTNARRRGDLSSLTGEWLLSGQLTMGGEAEFRLTDTTARCTLPGGEVQIDASGSLAGVLDPTGSGGLLAALHQWRRLLVTGPDGMGDVTYLGTLPTGTISKGMTRPADSDALADVLVAASSGVESRFYFDPQSGDLLGMELFSQADGDPCELRFADWQELDGRWFPRRLQVRYGNEIYGEFQFTKVELSPAVEK